MEAYLQRREASQIIAHLLGRRIGTGDEQLSGGHLISEHPPLPGNRNGKGASDRAMNLGGVQFFKRDALLQAQALIEVTITELSQKYQILADPNSRRLRLERRRQIA